VNKEPRRCPETSVSNSCYALRNSLKEISSYPFRGLSLKSRRFRCTLYCLSQYPIETVSIQSYCYCTWFDTVAATTQAPNTSATDVPLRRYKPSCNNCFHLGITAKSVGASILILCREQVTTARHQLKTVRRMSESSVVMKLYAM